MTVSLPVAVVAIRVNGLRHGAASSPHNRRAGADVACGHSVRHFPAHSAGGPGMGHPDGSWSRRQPSAPARSLAHRTTLMAMTRPTLVDQTSAADTPAGHAQSGGPAATATPEGAPADRRRLGPALVGPPVLGRGRRHSAAGCYQPGGQPARPLEADAQSGHSQRDRRAQRSTAPSTTFRRRRRRPLSSTTRSPPPSR